MRYIKTGVLLRLSSIRLGQNHQSTMSSVNGNKKKLEFYYDIVSPYSWFAYEVLQRYKTLWNIDIKLVPSLLGGIFQGAANQSPLVVSPTKAIHMATDLDQCADYYGVELRHLKDVGELLKKGSLQPMRCVTVCDMYYPELLDGVNRGFWMKRWYNDTDFTTSEAIEDVIKSAAQKSSSAGKEVLADIMTKMGSQEVKDKLKSNTLAAVEYGIFGVPSVIWHKDDDARELFFGADRIPMLAHRIGENWVGPHPKSLSGKL